MAYRHTEHTQAKKADTRARILKEARQLVTEGGFAAAAIAPVAKRSGIATGTIYRHFPSKAELVAEVFRQATQHELEAVTAATLGHEDPATRLRRGIKTFASRALQSPRLAYALIAEPVDPLVEKERLSYRFAYAQAFEDLILDGMSCGAFAAQSPTVTSAALVGMLAESLVGPLAPKAQSFDEQLTEREQFSVEQKQTLLDEITALCLRAVGVKKQP